jgi:hypothetical protein
MLLKKSVNIDNIGPWYWRAQTFKQPNIQNFKHIRFLAQTLILLFTKKLAEPTKCFDYLYFKSTKVRQIKNWNSQNTYLTQLNSEKNQVWAKNPTFMKFWMFGCLNVFASS